VSSVINGHGAGATLVENCMSNILSLAEAQRTQRFFMQKSKYLNTLLAMLLVMKVIRI
jgi:hypothetical protein